MVAMTVLFILGGLMVFVLLDLMDLLEPLKRRQKNSGYFRF